MPLLTVGKHGHGNAGVERILKELAVGTGVATMLLHLNEHDRAIARMTKRIVHAPAFKGEFWCYHLGAEDGPVESME